nr:NSP4 [Rotavirus A]
MDRMPDVNFTQIVEDLVNTTESFISSNVYFHSILPYFASILTVVYTVYKAGTPVLKTTCKATKCTYTASKRLIISILNVFFKLFKINTVAVDEDIVASAAQRILSEIDRQVKMIEKLTTREVEQLKLLMDIYEEMKGLKRIQHQQQQQPSESRIVNGVDMSLEYNRIHHSDMKDWLPGQNPYEPKSLVTHI